MFIHYYYSRLLLADMALLFPGCGYPVEPAAKTLCLKLSTGRHVLTRTLQCLFSTHWLMAVCGCCLVASCMRRIFGQVKKIPARGGD
jgi:hypothetical protein